jgi:hypothetical protein
MAVNYKSSPGTAGAARQAQVADADWVGGMNLGNCAPGVGINTGDYGPKLSDWATSDWNGVNAAPYDGLSQFLGGIDPAEAVDADTGNGTEGQTNQVVLTDPTLAANDGFTYIVAAADVADGDPLGTNIINRTGVTVPTGAYCWGSLEIPDPP